MNTRLLREFIRSSIHIGKLNEGGDYDSLPSAALERAISFLVKESGGDGVGTGKLRAVMDSREASISDTWISSLGILISDANKWDEENDPALFPGGTALLCCHVIATGNYNDAMWALGGIIGVLRNIPGISNPFTNTSGAALQEGPAGFIDKTFTKFGSASKTALEQSIIVMEKLIASDDTALETIKTSSADATFDASKISVKPLKYNEGGMMELTGEQLPLTIAFRNTMTNTWYPKISDELQACMNTYSVTRADVAGLKSFSQLDDQGLNELAEKLDPDFYQLHPEDQQAEIMRLNNLRLEADAVARKTKADIEKLSTPAAIKDLVDTMIRRKGFAGSFVPIRYSSAVARAAKTSAKVGKGTAAAGLVLGGGAGLLDALWDTVSEPRFENFNVVCNDSLYAMKEDAQMLENEINNINPLGYGAVRQQLADLQEYSLD